MSGSWKGKSRRGNDFCLLFAGGRWAVNRAAGGMPKLRVHACPSTAQQRGAGVGPLARPEGRVWGRRGGGTRAGPVRDRPSQPMPMQKDVGLAVKDTRVRQDDSTKAPVWPRLKQRRLVGDGSRVAVRVAVRVGGVAGGPLLARCRGEAGSGSCSCVGNCLWHCVWNLEGTGRLWKELWGEGPTRRTGRPRARRRRHCTRQATAGHDGFPPTQAQRAAIASFVEYYTMLYHAGAEQFHHARRPARSADAHGFPVPPSALHALKSNLAQWVARQTDAVAVRHGRTPRPADGYDRTWQRPTAKPSVPILVRRCRAGPGPPPPGCKGRRAGGTSNDVPSA